MKEVVFVTLAFVACFLIDVLFNFLARKHEERKQ